MRNANRFICLLVVAALAGRAALARQIEQKERHLGPTGLFGVVSPGEIEITGVQKSSPADGKLKIGDVIVRAGGVPFKEDPRRQLADAIDQAETAEAKGVLALTLKGGDKVDLQLKVLGAYSATAPYNCPKTDAIITQTADHLVKTRNFGILQIGLLGLLATGEQKYIDVVKEVLHRADWARPDIRLRLQDTSLTTWYWSYKNLLLCEYYLLTKDAYVLPAIRTYSVTAAMGRDAGGLWGHRMADPDINGGKLHGRLYGYAQMNQPSLAMFISLLLADKCEIRHPELQAAIKQDHTFYDSYVGKGTLPYGVHDPNPNSFNNNGMSGSAAVAFSLVGDARGSAFFSRMSAAGYTTMETGHTGHYFNQLWTGLGANLAGPEASAAFFKETRWLHTLNRTWDGDFTYDDAAGGVFSYSGCSDAGSHLLNYCLGRRKLYITGKDADPSIWLKGLEVGETIALATLDVNGKSDAELLALLGHPMPKVRLSAIRALHSRGHDLAGPIGKLLKEGTDIQRRGAIAYLGYGPPQEKPPFLPDDLASIMHDPNEDVSMRAAAAGALCSLGESAYKHFNEMLSILAAGKPQDPLGKIDEELGRALTALCPDPYKAGLVTDKDLFYRAVRKLLDHKRMTGRSAGLDLIAHIPLEDFYRVADKVMYIIQDKDPSYHSYHNPDGPVGKALTIFANLNIEEGIDLAFNTFDAKSGKAGFKLKMLMAVLPKYGANAKRALPRVKAIRAGKFQKAWNAMIRQIESSTEARKMIGFEQAKRFGADKKSLQGALPVPRRGFVSVTSAETWEQGLISGNGTIGVNVLSRPLDETLIFTHARMYLPNGNPTPPPDTAARLGEMRQLINRGFYQEAYRKGLEISGRSDFRYPDAFVPAFDMRIETSAKGEVRDFLRSVNFQTGVATVHWADDRGAFERRIFVSRADGVAVLQITGPGRGTIGCTMKLTARHPSPKLPAGLVKGSNEIFASHVGDVRATADANHLTFTARFTRAYPGSVQSLDGIARVVAPGAAIATEGDTMIVRNADRVVVLVRLEPVYEAARSHLDALERALDKIDPDYDRLLERHAAIHGGMFNRVRLDLGGGADHKLPTERLLEVSRHEGLSRALVEKVFDAGRYNIISCSGEMPPNLQGVWAGTYKSYWSGGFTENGNLPTAIAALLRGNTPELMLAYTRYIESLVPCLRVNARHIFGARGLVLPAHTSVHGYSLLPLGFGGCNWTAGAAWASHFFYDYYLYTGDRKFLAEHALPFMMEAALFYEDFLYEGPDGKYVFSPSDSPENTPSNSTTHVSFNATMDVAAAKELLGNLIEASHTLNVNRDKVPVWQKMLTKMPDYMYNEQGMVKEWLTPKLDDHLDHRHSSHLYALFDGLPAEIPRDPKLREGFRRIIAYKLEHHYKRAGFMAFGICQLGQAATSLGDGELAYQTVVRLVNNYWLSNLASTHNVKSVFNMDISGGLPAVIIKMLLDSSPGEVRLLPALPKQWPAGALDGALCRGQIEVETLQWQPGCLHVTLRSGKEQTVTLTAPARIDKVTVAAGKTSVKEAVHGYTCRVTLPKGQSVALELNLKPKDESP